MLDVGHNVPLFDLDWIPLAMLAGASLLYVRAVRVLAGRGRRVPSLQIASFFAGILMIFVATQTAVDSIGEDSLLSVHMVQHLLLADLPAPLLLLGVRAPLLYFFWPKPVLVAAARSRALRTFWAWLRQPRIALGTWLVTLYAWHIPAAYDAALGNYWIHGLEHLTFALGAMLSWWPLMDPTHERVEGRIWKSFYVACARMVGSVWGVVLIVSSTQLYPYYGRSAETYGISPHTDQQVAGALMMAVDFVIMCAGFIAFFALTSRDKADDPEAAALAEWEREAAAAATAANAAPEREPAGVA
jgi:putative copper resistance protein D